MPLFNIEASLNFKRDAGHFVLLVLLLFGLVPTSILFILDHVVVLVGVAWTARPAPTKIRKKTPPRDLDLPTLWEEAETEDDGWKNVTLSHVLLRVSAWPKEVKASRGGNDDLSPGTERARE